MYVSMTKYRNVNTLHDQCHDALYPERLSIITKKRIWNIDKENAYHSIFLLAFIKLIELIINIEINHEHDCMGLLPDTQNCGLRMRWEYRERSIPTHHRLQRKPLVSDPGFHYARAEMHVGIALTRGGGENVPGITGAWATRNFAYLVRGPLHNKHVRPPHFRALN